MNTDDSTHKFADKVLVKHIIVKDNYYQNLVDRLKSIVDPEYDIIKYILDAIYRLESKIPSLRENYVDLQIGHCLCQDFAVMGVINGWTKYDFMGSYKIGQYDVMYNNKPGYNKDYYGDAIYNEISEIISKENAEKTHKSQRIAFLKKLKNDGYAKSYVKIDDLKLINEILGKEIFTYDSNDNIVKCDVLSFSKVIDGIVKQVRDYDRSYR